jgi:hypothetical protein
MKRKPIETGLRGANEVTETSAPGANPGAPPGRPVERLFPFVLRTRTLLVGRENLLRSKRRLHFVLIPRDISAAGRAQVLTDFAHYPVVQHFTAGDLEKLFRIQGAKVFGFAKSSLAQSIYAELKAHRINQPVTKPGPPGPLTGGAASRASEEKAPGRERLHSISTIGVGTRD